MHGLALARTVAQTTDDGELFLERLQRLENRAQLEIRALLLRSPLLHDRAMREIHEPQLHERLRGGVGQRGGGGNHGIEQRQSDHRSRAPQDSPAIQIFLGDEH